MNRSLSRMFSVITILALMMMALPMQSADALSPDIVISQVYGGGGNTGAPYTHDFIELFNRGTSAVSLNGWSVQYASSTGTGNFGATSTQLTELPNVSLAPGQYFLIQEAGSTTGVALPAPDVIDASPIAMSATAGKVALVTSAVSLGCNGGSAPCSAMQLALIKDLVGYGGANFFEGAPTAALSNTTVALRNINGCSDTDNNAADFTVGAPAPRNIASPLSPCPVTPNLTINDVSASEGNSGTTSFDFTVSLSPPAGAGGVTFDIATADNTATVADNDYAVNSLTGQTIPAGSSSYTFSVLVNGDATEEPDETFFVNITNVTGATTADGQGQGTIVNDDVTITFIHDIQGSGGSVTGPGPFTVEAIVVGDYQAQGSGELRGFFVQEEDADVDDDPATSEGIFVFCSSCTTAVSVGDKVQVTGTASDFFGMSQLSATTAGSVSVLSLGNPLPTAASIDLPASGSTRAELTFENIEGMLVTFTDTLYVSEYFELARYGQIILTADARPSQFTDANEPSVPGYAAFLADLNSRRIILDDDNNIQNDALGSTPAQDEPYFWPQPGLSTSKFFRGGDTITNLTGVLHWSFAGQTGTDAWRIRPVTEAFSYDFTPANARPNVPTVGGSLKVASFNVLNYFLTVDTTSSNNTGTCGPSGTLDCRGADSSDELQRQRTKMLTALQSIDADVFGLIEMENTTGVEPLANIVAGLPGYAYIDTGTIGNDAIKVGLIYRTTSVQPVGSYAILDSSIDPDFDTSRNRPALAQTFEELATGAHFTVVVNHFKSKGASELAEDPACASVPPTNPDCDQGDGQGFWNDTRTRAAQALADWLATDPTGSGDPDVLIIGDLNAYAKEDPIVALQNAGYTELVAAFGGPSAYSYLFDGQLGYLDHALANPSLTSQITGVAEWHINADEVPLFDYNDDVRDTGESSFERESTSLPLYETNEFRTSDHDPVVVGLKLHYLFTGFFPPIENLPTFNEVKAGQSIPVKFSLNGDQGLDIFATGYPRSEMISCDSTDLVDGTEETVSAGASGLTYDPLTDTYTYVWKTDKSWAGTCRQFVVLLDDGTFHRANFNFTQ